MSEHETSRQDETRDQQMASEPGEDRLEAIPRRKFLGSLLGAAAGGALLPWSAASVVEASSTTGPFCDPSEVPWDINPFDPTAVVNAAQAMSTFAFSSSARANLASIQPIAQRWAEGGAASLDDKDFTTVFELGWLPTAEVNRSGSLRSQVNAALAFRDNVWAPTSTNRGLYQSPVPQASRARLQRFEAGVQVQEFALILVGIIIVILVCDFPEPAR
jgi:hypothetical protein